MLEAAGQPVEARWTLAWRESGLLAGFCPFTALTGEQVQDWLVVLGLFSKPVPTPTLRRLCLPAPGLNEDESLTGEVAARFRHLHPHAHRSHPEPSKHRAHPAEALPWISGVSRSPSGSDASMSELSHSLTKDTALDVRSIAIIRRKHRLGYPKYHAQSAEVLLRRPKCRSRAAEAMDR